MLRKLAGAAAALGLCLAGMAHAAEPPARPCITRAEMQGMVAYFLPNVLAEVAAGCTPHLPPESHLRRGIAPLLQGLEQGREAAWPTARSAFFKMSGAGATPELARLSDRSLRPLVDEMLAEKMKIPVTAPVCGEVNDIIEALAPLDAPQTANLIATILAAAARNDSKLRSCPREAR